jgi:hypothetical protein
MRLSSHTVIATPVLTLLASAALLPAIALAQQLPDYEIIPIEENINNSMDATAFVVARKTGKLYSCHIKQMEYNSHSLRGFCQTIVRTNLTNHQAAQVPRRRYFVSPIAIWLIDQTTGALQYCVPDGYCVNVPMKD